jgi:hypothetical protein
MTVIRGVVMRLTVPGNEGEVSVVDAPRDTNGLHRQTRPIGRDRALPDQRRPHLLTPFFMNDSQGSEP